MQIHGVVLQGSVIGFVVAHNEIRIRAELIQERPNGTGIGIPQDAGVPGTGNTPPDGRIAVNGDDDRRSGRLQHLVQRPVDQVVIGPVEPFDPPLPFRSIDPGIPGNDRPVGQAHDDRRIVLSPIRIDQQPGIGRHQGRRIQPTRKFHRQRTDTDVIADVPFELLLRKPQIAIVRRHSVAGMVAQQKQSACKVPRNSLGRNEAGAGMGRRQCHERCLSAGCGACRNSGMF